MSKIILCDHNIPLGQCCPCQLTISETELLEIENRLLRLLKSVAPQCEPAKTLIGIYWQIDNYIAGQNQEITALRSLIKEMRLLLSESINPKTLPGQWIMVVTNALKVFGDKRVIKIMEDDRCSPSQS